ncbi:MAG: HAD-IA family hydrolase [Bacteroidaceae bacterium]|nr:HAD-IA family hydrolase [Bacteroidaceae bacterium]
MLKAVCFDMDGVLYDSMPHHAEAWAKASEDFGLGMTYHDVFMQEGRTGFSTIDIFTRKNWGRPTNHDEVNRIYARKCEYFNVLPEAKPMPGARSLLEQIKADGLQIVLVTGSAQHSLLERLNRDYPSIFHSDLMVTGFDVTYGKPDPEPYLMAMHKAAVRPDETMVVENAPLGVRSAVAAGAYTVACNTGPLPDKVLRDEGAAIVLPSLQALSDQWSQIRKELV